MIIICLISINVRIFMSYRQIKTIIIMTSCVISLFLLYILYVQKCLYCLFLLFINEIKFPAHSYKYNSFFNLHLYILCNSGDY